MSHTTICNTQSSRRFQRAPRGPLECRTVPSLFAQEVSGQGRSQYRWGPEFLVRRAATLVPDPARASRGGLERSDLSPLAKSEAQRRPVWCEHRGFRTVVGREERRIDAEAAFTGFGSNPTWSRFHDASLVRALQLRTLSRSRCFIRCQK